MTSAMSTAMTTMQVWRSTTPEQMRSGLCPQQRVLLPREEESLTRACLCVSGYRIVLVEQVGELYPDHAYQRRHRPLQQTPLPGGYHERSEDGSLFRGPHGAG